LKGDDIMATLTYDTTAPSRYDSTDRLARGLGWFSLALGTAEVLSPKKMARAFGMPRRDRVFAAYGLREIVTGLGILAARDPKPWISARIAGDALDVATLAPALERRNRRRGTVGWALAAVAGVSALDVLCRKQLETARVTDAVRDYSDRSGFPRPAAQMRGAARDFTPPSDMLTPEAMRPYSSER
jgi:hypothetical protein